MLEFFACGHYVRCRCASYVSDFQYAAFVAIEDGATAKVVPVEAIGVGFSEQVNRFEFQFKTLHSFVEFKCGEGAVFWVRGGVSRRQARKDKHGPKLRTRLDSRCVYMSYHI
jgi:hypothetical protein